MILNHCDFPISSPTETKAWKWTATFDKRLKKYKRTRFPRKLGRRSPWNEHFDFVSRSLRKKEFGKFAWINFFQECERPLKCTKRSVGVFSIFFVLSWLKSSWTAAQVCKVQSTKSEKSWKNHHFLMTENWENDDHFGHFGFSWRCTNFFILHGFSEISQIFFPTFFTFFSWKVYGCFQVPKYTFFLALSGSCSVKTLKHKSWKAAEQAPLEHFDRFGPLFWKMMTQNDPNGLFARSTNFLT